MRVISKFRDYYDSASSYGVDKTIIYNRVTRKVNKSTVDDFISKYTLPMASHFFSQRLECQTGHDIQINPFILIFCGKGYLGVSTTKINMTYPSTVPSRTNVEVTTTSYNIKDLIKNTNSQYSKTFHVRNDLIDWISEYQEKDFSQLHIEASSPVILIHKKSRYGRVEITLDPILKDLQFFKEVDAFSAFQDLSIYFNGVLCQSELNRSTVSNKDKIIKAGFDPTKSFRRPKQHK